MIKKYFLLFFLLSFSIFSQKISWEYDINLSDNDLSFFKSSSNLIEEVFQNSINTNNRVAIPIPTSSRESEEFIFKLTNPFTKELAEDYKNILIFEGNSKTSSKKAFFNFIGEYISITILDDDKTISISNFKSLDTFILKTIDETEKNKEINFEQDCKTSLAHSDHEQTPAAQNLDPVGKTPKLYKYRIAIVPTAEWSNYYINLYEAQDLDNANKRLIVMSELGVAVAALNSITERDLSIKFELVDNNEVLIDFDSNTDGLSNNNKYAQLGEGMSILNNLIGFNNYDIGHVFNSGGGGVAYLWALCGGSKGGGVTGGFNGTGFHFVFAHEVGHQLGAPHTFNANVGSTTNRVETNAGLTIMGYGPRGVDNLYYHAKSIKEISEVLASRDCGQEITDYDNQVPIYKTAPTTFEYEIPTGTPFVLGEDFEVEDPDDDELLMNWDQLDGEKTANPPMNTSTIGPAFISLFPDNNLPRYFPNLETILSGEIQNEDEVIPQLSRQMNFTLTVRDDNDEGGNVLQEDFLVKTKFSDSGPFKVYSQNVEGIKYNQEEEFEVTWNHRASAETQMVNIELSYDGGYSFPVKLTESTENDGKELVKIPNFAKSLNSRLRVKAVDNIFFAINDATFEIIDPIFDFNLAYPQSVKCFGEKSDISIDPTGGAGGPYTIKWENLVNNNWNEITDSDNNPKSLIQVLSGEYRVKVSDKDQNEFISENIIITGPSKELSLEIEESNLALNCFGVSDGFINVKISGGTAPYNLLFNNQVLTNNLNNGDTYEIKNIKKGSYEIYVIDDNGCLTNVINREVTGPESPISIDAFEIISPTENNNDGSININISGGTSPYEYSWIGPNNFSSTSQNLTNIEEGTYTLLITDDKGCNIEKKFNVEEESDYNYNILVNEIKCKGESSGQIETDPKGGSGSPFKIEWYDENDNLISTNKKVENLKAGTYILKIKDSEDNEFPIKEIIITEPEDSLNLVLSDVVNASCYGGQDGMFTISVVGGKAPYSYYLNDELLVSNSGNVSENRDSLIKSNLYSGIYSLRIEDSNNCSSIVQVSISQPDSKISLIDQKVADVSKLNFKDGSIELEISGGTLNNNESYLIQWSGPNGFSSNLKNIYNLGPGTYNLSISDSNDCTFESEFNIESPQAFNFSNLSTSNPSCYNSDDGNIYINFEGGYGQPYIVNWFVKNSSGDFIAYNTKEEDLFNLKNIKSGFYKLEVIDKNGVVYEYNQEIEIQSPNEFIVDSATNIVNESCPEEEDGSFNIKVSGGTAPYSYYFDDELIASNRGNINTNTDEYSVQNLKKNIYSFYAIDSKGCVSNFNNITIGGNDLIEILNQDIAVSNISCVGNSDGKINLIVGGGDGSNNFTFNWTGPEGYSSTNEDLNNLSVPGLYSVEISQGSCKIVQDFNLIEPTELKAEVSSLSHYQCSDNQGSYSIKISGGTPPYTVNNQTFGRPGVDGATVYYSFQGPGIKNIQITDANNCKLITLKPEILGPESNLVIEKTVEASCVADQNSTLKLKLSGGTPFTDPNNASYKFFKVNINGGNNFSQQYNIPQGEEYEINNLNDGGYTIFVTERDHTQPVDSSSQGCTTDDEISISSVVVWDRKGINDIKCVDSNNNPSNDGSVIYTNLRGGNPFIENGTTLYKYELILNDNILESGNVQRESDLEFENLQEGNYRLKLMDLNDCLIEDKFEINKPAPLKIQIDNVSKSCFNPDQKTEKGTVKFTVFDGTPIYDFYLVDELNNLTETGISGGGVIGQNIIGYSGIIDGISKGKYRIKAVDKNDCEIYSEEFLIEEHAEFEVSNVDIKNVTCFNEKNGSVEIGSITGGVLPYKVNIISQKINYQFSINEEVNNYLIDDLDVDDYEITIEDSEGICGTYFQKFSIKQQTNLTLTIDEIKNPTCFDFPDGEIKVDIQGGSLAQSSVLYKIYWYKNDQIITDYNDKRAITGLENGFYKIKVDAISQNNNVEVICSVEETFSLTRPQRIFATENLAGHVDINCNSESNGQFELFFNGGVPPYDISINNSIMAQGILDNSYVFKNLPAGIYNVDVIDNNNCKFSESVDPNSNTLYGELTIELKEPEKLLEIESKLQNATCFDSSDGIIEVFVSGGRAPYKMEWISDNNYEILEEHPEDGYFKISTGVGNITFKASDSTNNCGSVSDVLTVSSPEKLDIFELNKKDNICYNDQLGEYEVYVSGIYNQNILSSTIEWYVLIDGVYKTINSIEGVSIDSNKLKASNLPPGNYRIIASKKQYRNFVDGEITECSTIYPFQIIGPPEPFVISEIIESKKNVECNLDSGSIEIKLEGSNGPYFVKLNGQIFSKDLNENNNITIDNLKKGEYKIQVIGENQCISNEIISVVEKLETKFDLVVDQTDSNNNNIIEGNIPLCYGGLGSFYFEIENNKSSLPLKYFLNDKEIFVDQEIVYSGNGFIIRDLELGEYTLNIIDDQNACISLDFEILNAEKVRLIGDDTEKYIEQKIKCYNQQTDSDLNLGIIDVTGFITGGVPFSGNDNYKIEWSGPDFSSDKKRISVSIPGIYKLKITDSLSCVSDIYRFDMTVDRLSANSYVQNVSCDGDLGNITANPQGGTAPYIIDWYETDSDGNLLNLLGNQLKIENLDTGFYSSVLTDFLGCKLTENYEIIDEKIFVFDEEPIVTEQLCLLNRGDVLVKLNNPFNTKIDFEYNGEILKYDLVDEYDDYTLYIVEIENPIENADLIVFNNYNCFYRFNLNLGVGDVDFELQSKGNIIEDYGKISLGSEISIVNKSLGKYFSVSYDFGDGSAVKSYDILNDRVVSNTYDDEGYYTISVRIYGKEDCYKEMEKTILVGKGYTFSTPNAFTPNRDGINDSFRPIFTGIISGTFKVFNNQGLILHDESFDITGDLRSKLQLDGWNASNRRNQDKVFYYKFNGKTLDDYEIDKSGYFVIIE